MIPLLADIGLPEICVKFHWIDRSHGVVLFKIYVVGFYSLSWLVANRDTHGKREGLLVDEVSCDLCVLYVATLCIKCL